MITNKRVLGEAAGVAVRRRRPFLFLILDLRFEPSAFSFQLKLCVLSASFAPLRLSQSHLTAEDAKRALSTRRSSRLNAENFFNRKSKI